jgi:hypothetical protein
LDQALINRHRVSKASLGPLSLFRPFSQLQTQRT